MRGHRRQLRDSDPVHEVRVAHLLPGKFKINRRCATHLVHYRCLVVYPRPGGAT